jgi:hypothetical protein
MFRSWKKAVIAGIGGAIVLAVVAQITGISSKVQTEIGGSPPPAAVYHVSHPAPGGSR